jgi:hypothetical protein
MEKGRDRFPFVFHKLHSNRRGQSTVYVCNYIRRNNKNQVIIALSLLRRIMKNEDDFPRQDTHEVRIPNCSFWVRLVRDDKDNNYVKVVINKGDKFVGSFAIVPTTYLGRDILLHTLSAIMANHAYGDQHARDLFNNCLSILGITEET